MGNGMSMLSWCTIRSLIVMNTYHQMPLQNIISINNEYEIVPDNFEPTYNPFSESTKWHLNERRQSLIDIAENGSLLNE